MSLGHIYNYLPPGENGVNNSCLSYSLLCSQHTALGLAPGSICWNKVTWNRSRLIWIQDSSEGLQKVHGVFWNHHDLNTVSFHSMFSASVSTSLHRMTCGTMGSWTLARLGCWGHLNRESWWACFPWAGREPEVWLYVSGKQGEISGRTWSTATCGPRERCTLSGWSSWL